MKTFLVTGPIGSGKSEVCRYLASKGYPVYDCDSRTKGLYESVPGLKSRIETALGIDWSEIGIIFSDSGRRETLERIVFPLVADDIRAWKSGLDSRLAFIESAIATEKREFDGLYDGVLLVTADYGLRRGRNPKAAQRDSLQTFDLSGADWVLENDSTIEELHLKTDDILCRLI